MLENRKIGVRQFTLLVIILTIGSSILVAPSGLAHEAKQDGWISEIISLIVGLLLVWMYGTLGSRFPTMTLSEYSEVILGKWLGKLVSLSFISYFFILASLLLREIGDFLTTEIMPETPIQAIHILFIGIVIMGARLGLEAFVRASEIFFPWIILLFLIMVLAIFPRIKFEHIQPVLEEGLKPIFRGVFGSLGLPYLELVVFLMIFPNINWVEKVKKAFLIGTLIGGIILIINVLVAILTLGADVTARQIYPSYALARMINIAQFFQRVEAIMAGIWFMTIFFKMTLCFYASAVGFAQTLQFRDYRFLLIPFGVLCIVLSIAASPNIIYYINFLAQIWTPYSLTYGLFLPLVLLGVAIIRRKKL